MNITLNKDTPHLRKTFRDKRDRMLLASDPWMLPDRGLTEDEIAQLTFFRQQLRDCPNTAINATLWTIPAPPIFLSEIEPFNEIE